MNAFLHSFRSLFASATAGLKHIRAKAGGLQYRLPRPTKRRAPRHASERLDLATLSALLGIWGGIVALPVAIVGILSLPVAQKVMWTLIFALDAAACTILMRMLMRDRLATPQQRPRRRAILGLSLFIPVSVVLGLVAGQSWESRVRASAGRACAIVGTGNDEYQQAFYD